MGAPQYITIGLIGVNLLCNAYLHGKPKTGKHDFFLILMGQSITIILLVWGGFFK